jgi:hypothetical protein
MVEAKFNAFSGSLALSYSSAVRRKWIKNGGLCRGFVARQ